MLNCNCAHHWSILKLRDKAKRGSAASLGCSHRIKRVYGGWQLFAQTMLLIAHYVAEQTAEQAEYRSLTE